ncbi:MAG: ammonium transporter [Chloroherpetonaceae bacterium]|nr:ammonium transporter [Chthonomonadaceae bacterium]MDW8207721.1 ammonium transporter [Chloroherpetonaceae bacterium]
MYGLIDLWKRFSAARALTLLLILMGTCAGMGAFGQDAGATAEAAAAPKIDTGDTAWLLVSTALVMLMTPGLALFYGGMVRAKNVLNMLLKSFIALSVVTVLWVVLGYSLAFAKGSPFIGSFEFVGLNGVGQEPDDFYATTTPHLLFMVFQLMFAIITPALISGAVAERMKFSAYVLFIGIWSLVVYSPLAHMVWGEEGFLLKLGALDFAGGTVVHISSGASALVLAILLGKRKLGSGEDVRPHNLPMTLIGTGLLWFGWFGFNGGSAVASNGLAVSAFVVTHVAAAVAGLVWVLIEWVAYKKPTALGFATGAVAGLVAITPASGFVGPIAAIVIGAGVSFVSFFAIKMKAKLGYDDTLDVFGVHCMGGIWGALATGLFAQKAINSAGADGLFFGGGFELLGKQVVGVLVALALAVVGTLVIGGILKATIGLRAADDEEDAGLDLALHGESAYAGPSYGAEAVVAESGAMFAPMPQPEKA